VTCSTCGAQNDVGRKFCLECGSRLAASCPACGSTNPPAARFCGECGGTLAAEAGTAATPGTGARTGRTGGPTGSSPAAAGPIAERRLVSVLFADIVGFTPFAEEKDPEEVRELLSRYFDIGRDVIARYGGTVEKFIGDAVMAVWGAPVAQEDDAERAVRAALELVDAVRAIGPGIQARAGIMTGEAAVNLGATDQGMVAGDLVNTASRVQSEAEPGTVLVGETTMRAASAAIVFEDAGTPSLKGKADPIHVWRARRIVAERGGRNRREGLEAPFVGRDDELRYLKDLLHATSRERRVRLVSVSGQAGIGKSRLAWEFLKYIDGLVETIYWHDGRSPSYDNGLTFWALAEIVRQRAGLVEGADEPSTRTAIGETVRRFVAEDAEQAWIEGALLTLVGVSEGGTTDGSGGGGSDQLYAAWRTFFERIAERGTTVLVFEDLQWADPGLLDFIDHLTEWARNVPLLVVTLARPELLDRRPGWGAGKRNFASIALEPLSDAAMRELLAGLVPGLPDRAVERIVDRAAGIPLYAVETVRMLVSEGRLIAEAGTYRPVGDLSELAVPETLRSLIASRLDGLEATDRALLQTAAVLGQSFGITALAAVTGETEPDLEPRLRGLVRRELLTLEMDPRSPERGQYAFVQGLIREVAYGTLARRDRQRLHLAAARYFESLGDETLAGILAEQYLAASRNAQRGPEADAIAGQARIALRAAGDRAIAVGSPLQALGFYRAALEVTAEGRDRAQIAELAGEAASRAAEHDDADALLGEAIAAYRSLGDRPATARAIAARGGAMMGLYQIQAGLAILEPAAEEFADLDRSPDYARLLASLARFKMMDQGPDALAATDRALVLAERLDLVPLIADLLVTRGTVLTNLGRGWEGLTDIEGGIKLAAANDLARTELRGRTNISVALGWRDPRAQLENCKVGLELGRRMGLAFETSLMLSNGSDQALQLGEWDWAVRELTYAMEHATGDERLRAEWNRIQFLAERGEDVSAAVAEMEAIHRERGAAESFWATGERYLHATVWFPQGRWTETADTLLIAAEMDAYNAASSYASAGVAAVLAGDEMRTRAARDGLERANVQGPVMRDAQRTLEAGLAQMEGRTDDALRLWMDALAGYRRTGLRRLEALIGVQMAALLGADHPAAADAVDGARRIFSELRAQAWLDRLDEIAHGQGSVPRAATVRSSVPAS
jgi:class 3 adenylate cyclase/tetratricopeptide (TPR) repeat protein